MEKFKITKPCSPSEMPVVKSEKMALLVTMSCGGGFGGSRWEELIEYMDLSKIPSNKMLVVTDATNGKKFTINTKFVVKANVKKVVEVFHDHTAHANYYERTCKKAFSTSWFVLDLETDYEVVDKHDSTNKPFRKESTLIPLDN